MKTDELTEQSFSLMEKTNYFAARLFPYATKENARRLLTRLCRRDPELLARLSESGWHTADAFIARRQMRIILRRLAGD